MKAHLEDKLEYFESRTAKSMTCVTKLMGLHLTSTYGRLSSAEWQDDRQSRIGKDIQGDSNDMI